jgi:hypothetical protein
MHFLKKHKKPLVIIGSITAGLVTVSCISLYLIRKKPIRLAFSSYNTINNGIDTKEVFKKKEGVGNLIVVTHSYQHIDDFIMSNEILIAGYKHSNYIIASWFPTFIKKYIFPILFVKDHLNLIVLKDRSKNSEFIKEKIINGYNVVIFLHPGQKSKGAYYIQKDTNCNVILGSITSDDTSLIIHDKYDHKHKKHYYFHSCFRRYQLEYDTFENSYETESPEEYMLRLQEKLFLKN